MSSQGLKDHQIAKLANDIRDDLKDRLFSLHFPQSLRGIISESICKSLRSMDAKLDK